MLFKIWPVLMQTLVPSRVKGKITVLESVEQRTPGTMEQISVRLTVQLESEVKILGSYSSGTLISHNNINH